MRKGGTPLTVEIKSFTPQWSLLLKLQFRKNQSHQRHTMSEDHTHDTKHVEEEYSDDGYDRTLLAYANNEDLDKEEDEEEEEETEEEVKLSRGNIKDSKKILLPYFLQLDTEVMDCPYLLFHSELKPPKTAIFLPLA